MNLYFIIAIILFSFRIFVCFCLIISLYLLLFSFYWGSILTVYFNYLSKVYFSSLSKLAIVDLKLFPSNYHISTLKWSGLFFFPLRMGHNFLFLCSKLYIMEIPKWSLWKYSSFYPQGYCSWLLWVIVVHSVIFQNSFLCMWSLQFLLH